MLALQQTSTPAHSISDTVVIFTLPVAYFHTSSTIDAQLPVYDALKEKQYYEPLFLNDLAPTTPRDHYHFIQNLKENVVVSLMLFCLHIALGTIRAIIIFCG